MTKKSKVFLTVASLCTMALSLLPTSTLAENRTYRADEKGKITIKYYDDNQEKKPVIGSQWRIYKVGDITYTNGGEGVDALTITSLIDNLEITRETKAEDVLEKIEYKTITESKI